MVSGDIDFSSLEFDCLVFEICLEFGDWDLVVYGFAIVGCLPYDWWGFSGDFGEDNTGTTLEQHRNNTTTTLLKQSRGIGSKGQGGKGGCDDN